MNNTEKIFKDKLIENYLSKFTKEDVPDFEGKSLIDELYQENEEMGIAISRKTDVFSGVLTP
ncbi:MAG: hypothetical protein NC433_05155 [Clostridiales bacterium]|nr:hypothetical protein [Clostridiales bacterium]